LSQEPVPKITADQIAAAYSVARAVAVGEISEADGVRQLVRDNRMSASSASDFIRNLRQMLNGAEYQRTLSIAAVDFYLPNIRADFGESAYRNALRSVERHLAYYESLSTGHKQPGLQRILDEHKQASGPAEFGEIEIALQAEVQSSLALPQGKRLQRLSDAPRKPSQIVAAVAVFVRNPDVIAEVLLRANGTCEDCGKAAPFSRRSDGSPYLEVHHKIRLADGGDDTVENAVAVCPNCHRRAHYG
jgi:5-methylcytosine-specific restriction protein A